MVSTLLIPEQLLYLHEVMDNNRGIEFQGDTRYAGEITDFSVQAVTTRHNIYDLSGCHHPHFYTRPHRFQYSRC